ncbi:MAG: alpha/beta hydrolase [Bacteroidales bacterium]|nr:alpha/beta hydrolase [Bacteroidales bacterium]
MNRIKILSLQLMIVVCPFIKAGNYTSQNVIYYSADKSLHFGATLTIPEKVKKPAVVVLVTGTYPQNRDCVMAGHKMFAEIADYLSSRGIAVLRSDDRGVGQSNGVYETSTTADFADDVLSAVAYLKTRKDINVHEIGLLGHSEGGAVISIAASKSKDVAFMISMAGLATEGLASLIRQNEDLVNAANIPDYDKKRSNDINNRMFQVAYKYADSDSLEAKLNETYTEWKVKDDAYFKTLNIEFDHFRFPIYSYVNQAKGAWYRFFIRYNPAIYLSKVNIPVLALNGEKDVMVACKPSLDNWKRYLSHNKDVTVVPLPGLNHLFLPCTKGTPDEYATIKAPISKDALEIIYRWIKKRI